MTTQDDAPLVIIVGAGVVVRSGGDPCGRPPVFSQIRAASLISPRVPHSRYRARLNILRNLSAAGAKV